MFPKDVSIIKALESSLSSGTRKRTFWENENMIYVGFCGVLGVDDGTRTFSKEQKGKREAEKER